MEQAAIELIKESVIAFLFVVTLFGIGYGAFHFGQSILSMLREFLTGLLDELKDVIKSITDLSEAEKIASARHTEEHREIMSQMRGIHNDIISNKK